LQVHLSAYERLQRKYRKKLHIKNDSDISLLKVVIADLQNTATKSFAASKDRIISQRQLKTVAIMPFLGVNMGAVIIS